MFRSAAVFGLYLSFAIAVGAACSSGQPETPGDDSFDPPGSGGTGTGNGGTGTGMGGTTGGSVAAGGTTGGSVAAGGTTGGSVAAGGTTGGTVGGAGRATGGTTGGTVAGAGRANTGGTTGGTGTAVGGATAVGGSAGTGSAAGGTGGTGSDVACDPSGFAVTMDGFVRAPMKGGACWHGYAYGAGSTMTTINYCGQTGAKDFTKCMGMLSIAGTLEASTEANSYAGFVLVGFSVNQTAGSDTKSTVTPTGTGIVVTGAAAAGRVQLQNGTTYYCANFVSGTAIPYTTFNTKCYDTPPDGVAYAKTPIDTVALQIPGGAADAAYTLSLTKVEEM